MQAFFEISRWQTLDILSSTGNCLKNFELVNIPLPPVLLHTFHIPNTTQDFTYLTEECFANQVTFSDFKLHETSVSCSFQFLKSTQILTLF